MTWPPRCNRVYPRGCGATLRWVVHHGCGLGLSPRMRGNLGPPPPARMRVRSIPADAGQPRPAQRRWRTHGVYPRGCGATEQVRHGTAPRWGLSPRMRGNRDACREHDFIEGSIPADAGQPRLLPCSTACVRVYPRGCGATTPNASMRVAPWGLSPRMRGNRRPRPCGAGACGSIPADAGQPQMRWILCCSMRVYPRGCGATECPSHEPAAAQGLSPRMRGNPLLRRSLKDKVGSIPADAGQPSRSRWKGCIARVYPRGCGATMATAKPAKPTTGLSPRMRGNPWLLAHLKP